MKPALLAACAVVGALLATPALADGCNPPPPGLSINAWYGLCSAEIQNAWRMYRASGNYGSFDEFVPLLYRIYLQASSQQGGGGGGAPAPMVACSAAGQTYCHASGWLLTCNGAVWLTGAQRC